MSAVSIAIQTLLAAAGVTAIVSNRIEPYPVRSKTARPAIAVSLVGEQDGYHLAGAMEYPVSRVSIHCLAESATGAEALAAAVKAALINFRGNVLGREVTVFKAGSDYTDFAEDLSVFRRVSDYTIRWR